jgi:hypothetical protein
MTDNGSRSLRLIIGMVILILAFLFIQSVSFMFTTEVLSVIYALLAASFIVVMLLGFY